MPTNKAEEKWKRNLIKATEKAKKRGLPQHVIIKHIDIPTKRALEIAESIGYKYGDGLNWWDADPTCFDIYVNKDVVLSDEKRDEYNSILTSMNALYRAALHEFEELVIEAVFDGDRAAYEESEGVGYDGKRLLSDRVLPSETHPLFIKPETYKHLTSQEIVNLITYDLREYMWRFKCDKTDNGEIKAYLERTF